jgi:hypothetical protein
MKLSDYSRNKFRATFVHWSVPADFAEPFYNYLVHGFSPGSCFTAVLANDFMSAMSRSHPANTVEAFKALVGWMRDSMPEEAYGSYEKVKAWCGINPEQRRIILEHKNLIFTAKEETWLALKGEPTFDPVLY